MLHPYLAMAESEQEDSHVEHADPVWKSYFHPLFVATIHVFLESNVGADLFNPMVVTDTNLLFIGSVDYRAPLVADTMLFKPAGVDPTIPADLVTTNWIITVRQERVDIPAPNVANDIEVLAIHQVPPPAPLHGEGVGGLVEIADFLNVNPGNTILNNQGTIDIHSFSRPHGQHRDVLQARIDSIGAAVSRVSIRADHLSGPGNPPPVEMIPEPSTLLLLGSGLAGLARYRFRRRG